MTDNEQDTGNYFVIMALCKGNRTCHVMIYIKNLLSKASSSVMEVCP